ncbi:MAG: hypothetical protein WAV40_05260 [Microgenomates group bacterium]
MKKTEIIFLVVITLISLFLYTYRLDKTLIFSSDFANETYQILEMWQNKTITFLGAPMSFGQQSNRMIYHTSLSLYIGMIGSLMTGFSPLGPIIPNIFMFLVSLPFFYLLTKLLTKDIAKRRFITITYAFSPITISYARFFWVPNIIIPLSVIYWFLYYKFSSVKNVKLVNYLALGLLSGIMFNLHYMAIIALLVTIILFLRERKYKQSAYYLLGFGLTLLPFLFFEIRNNFYFIKTLFEHMFAGNATTGTTEEPNFIMRLSLLFSSILGIRSAELRLSTHELPRMWQYILGIFITIRYFLKSRDWKTDKQLLPLFWISFAIITLYSLAGMSIHIRYLFAMYPIFVYLLGDMLYVQGTSNLKYWFLALVMMLGVARITWTQAQTEFTFPLATLEKIGQIIVEDNFCGSYNITENITGDAQATAIRYFVQRDAKKKPQPNLDYQNLDALYAVASSVESILVANRWEYSATPHLQVAQSWDVADGVILYKFTRQ